MALPPYNANALAQISISDIHTEFGGPIPAKLSNYYRKSILPAIEANFADWPETLYSFLESESGVHTTNFSNGVSRYTTDGGDFGPRGDLTFAINDGSLSLVTDPVEGKVLQGQGINWGGVAQPRGFGKVAYSKVEAGITYTVTVRKKLVSDPTNTEFAPKMYTQLWCYNANGHYIGGYNIPNASPLVLTVAGGWTNIIGTYTLEEITAYAWLADTVYVRPYTYDNVYDYTNNVGVYNYIVCNCVVQTASFTTTASSGTLKGIGLDKIYNITNGVDDVYVLNGTTWSIDPQQSITDLGTPRQATNPYTKRITRIGDFLVIDSPTTQRIPTSGNIKFSDFLGSAQTSGPIFLTPSFLGDIDGRHPVSFDITAYSLSNAAITFSYDYLPGGLTNVVTTANTVIVDGNTYSANTITFSGTSEYTLTPTYPIGWNLQASDPYITIDRTFYYNNLNLTPTWVTPSGSLGSFANGSTVSIQFSATDPENMPIEYTVANGGALPNNLTLTYTGLLSGTLNATAATYPFSIRASDGPNYTDQSFSMVVEQNNPPAWQTPSGQLVGAGTNESYSTQLVANTAVSYTLVSGSLPTGMSLDTATGIISGTPTDTSQSQTATTFKSFPYMTSDTSPAGYTAYALATIPGTSTLTSNNVLQSGNYAYSLFDGNVSSMPAFNIADNGSPTAITMPFILGMISPYKVNVGAYDITCFSTNNSGIINGNTLKNWTLQGSNDGITWTTVDTRSNITSWSPYGYATMTFILSTPASYYQFRLYVTALGQPSNYAMLVSELKFYDYASVFTVRATAANGLYVDRDFGISVHTGATSVSWNSPAAGALGASVGGTSFSFSANISVVNAVGSTVYSVSAGSLPAGTSLNTSTGAITGTLTNSDSSYSFTVRATNNGIYSDRSFSGTVATQYPPVWGTSSGSIGTFTGSSPMSFAFSASDANNDSLTYSLASGSLPSGLTLSSTGILSGTPINAVEQAPLTVWKIIGVPVANGHWDTTGANSSVQTSASTLGYSVTNVNGNTILTSKPKDAPFVSADSTFVPTINQSYRITFKIKKTVKETNGVESFIKPAFDTYYADGSLNSSALGSGVVGNGYVEYAMYPPTFGASISNVRINAYNTADWQIGTIYEVSSVWTPASSYNLARGRLRVNRSYPDAALTVADASIHDYSDAVFEISGQNVTYETNPSVDYSFTINVSDGYASVPRSFTMTVH